MTTIAVTAVALAIYVMVEVMMSLGNNKTHNT